MCVNNVCQELLNNIDDNNNNNKVDDRTQVGGHVNVVQFPL